MSYLQRRNKLLTDDMKPSSNFRMREICSFRGHIQGKNMIDQLLTYSLGVGVAKKRQFRRLLVIVLYTLVQDSDEI